MYADGSQATVHVVLYLPIRYVYEVDLGKAERSYV